MYNPKNYAGVADNIFPNAGAVNMLGIHKDVPHEEAREACDTGLYDNGP
jgi:hypothetical protein